MSPRPPRRILLVEPSAQQRLLSSALLEGAGLEVLTAADGPEGLSLALSCHPDMILTELILSGFSGLELIRRCRLRLRDIPIWAVTLASGQSAVRSALAAGANFVFLKPVDWSELLCRLSCPLREPPPAPLCALLERLGLSPGKAGFFLTARCAQLLSGDPHLLLKQAYLQISTEEKLSPAAVARSVERSVHFLRASPTLPSSIPRESSGKDFLISLAQAATFPL